MATHVVHPYTPGAILDATVMTGWAQLSLLAGSCLVVVGISYTFMRLYDQNGNVIKDI